MNNYETKALQDRESHLIGAGISLILMSFGFGIVGGAFLASALALYVVTALFVVLGIAAIAAGIKEKRERKNLEANSNLIYER